MSAYNKSWIYAVLIVAVILLGHFLFNTTCIVQKSLPQILSSDGVEDLKSDTMPMEDQQLPTKYSNKRADCFIEGKRKFLEEHNFQRLVDEKRKGTDPEVISLLRGMMEPPSDHMLKRSNNLINTPQAQEAFNVLKSKMGGFFVECGALDGERSSNTIVLEVDKQWKGLLIEMDPFFYTQLLSKNRKSWSLNACLSPTPHVSYVNYSEDVSGRGQLLLQGLKGESKIYRKVPCFPLEALLLSLNRTKIDFFSLDVEGMELEVLKTIPFDKIDITVLTVEYLHVVGGPAKLQEFMESKGYVLHKKIDKEVPMQTLYVHDMFFVKKSYLSTWSKLFHA